MSSSDVFPVRNLGSAEDWGRKVEDRIRSSERHIESLTQTVNQLSLQLNSLAGFALPTLSNVPTNEFQSDSSRSVVIDVGETWLVMSELALAIPEGASQVIVNVSGTLQLQGVDPSVPAPWVRVRVGLGGSFPQNLPDPDGQGVRAANNGQGVFLATVSAAILLPVDANQTEVSVRLEGWNFSPTDFSTPGASNLASLFVQATSFPESVVSTGV